MSYAGRCRRTARRRPSAASLRSGQRLGKLDRLLSLMRMRRAPVDLQFLAHRPAQTILGEHPLHRPLDHALGVRLDHLLGVDLAEGTDVTGVPAVELVAELPAREVNLLGIITTT